MYTTDDRDNSRICTECRELFYPEQNSPFYVNVCEECRDDEDLYDVDDTPCDCPYCTGALIDDSYD